MLEEIFLKNLQKKKETEQWHEVLITSKDEKVRSPQNEEQDAQEPLPPVAQDSSISLQRVLAAKPSSVGAVLGLSSTRFGELPAESFLEVSPTAFRIARKVGELLTSGQPEDENPPMGGCGLIIDYGGAKAYGDSLRVREIYPMKLITKC